MAIQSTHEDGRTEPCLLRIANKSSRPVKAIWLGFDSKEICYMEIEAGHARPQQTYNTHVWRLRYADTDALIGDYSGPSAVLEVQLDGHLDVRGWSGTAPQPKPEWGEYSRRGEARGIEIWSYACVDERAVRTAEHIVRRMLEASPSDVVRRLVAGGAQVAIIGRQQVTTDIPAHSFMRWSEGGRDTDTTTRGLGGTEESPTTSCGEENLLMEDDRLYSSENILVHEFGHAVMNIGLSPEDRATIKQLYHRAHKSGRYDRGAYIMENEEEYWAEGTQAWFDATIRTDVTSGVNTREKLRARDPGLAAMMMRAYGDGTWRYPHDSPAPFLDRKSRKSEAADTPAVQVAAATAATALGVGSAIPYLDGGEGGISALNAPGMETSMERVRMAASSGGGGAGWLPALPEGCYPGGSGTASCGGSMWPLGSPGASVGCGAALWAAVRAAVGGHARSTVKLS